MGVSMSIALKARRTAKQSRQTMLLQIVRRAATLIAIGLFLSSNGANWSNWRIPGVLQASRTSWPLLGVRGPKRRWTLLHKGILIRRPYPMHARPFSLSELCFLLVLKV